MVSVADSLHILGNRVVSRDSSNLKYFDEILMISNHSGEDRFKKNSVDWSISTIITCNILCSCGSIY